MTKHISILKERRRAERRVILTPRNVKTFLNKGYSVLVESDAGTAAGFSNDDYRNAGAEIVSANEAWTESRIVLKYKEPQPFEFAFFRPDLVLGGYYHAEGDSELCDAIRASRMTAYSYEMFQTLDGNTPMPLSDNEIAGKVAIIYAAYHLLAPQGGCGTLLIRAPGAPAPKVVVIGYGNVGGAAARAAAALGADVTVFGSDAARLRRFAGSVPPNIHCALNTPSALEKAVQAADVVIGAILVSTYDTPAMISVDLVRTMKKGSLLIDLTRGYGAGYLPTAPFTSLDEPFVTVDGVLHMKIDAIAGAAPATASEGTSALMTPYLLALADSIYSGVDDPISRAGRIICDGKIEHPVLKDMLALEKRLALQREAN